MWNSYRTDGAPSVTSRVITYPAGNGDQIHAYVVEPTVITGPVPGVVAVHHVPGWDEFFLEFSNRLANHGYRVILPDLFCRSGHGTPDDVASKVRGDGGVADDSVVADCAAAREWLNAQPNSNGKVGIIGTCSGGRHSVLVASRVPGFDAVGDLWGARVIPAPEQLTPQQPVAPIDYVTQLQAPLLGIFGNDDQNPPPAQVDEHERILKQHGKAYEFHRYDGAGHGFFYYDRPAYRQEQAMDGWNKVFAFFGKHLS